MLSTEFDFHAPTTLPEALRLLGEHEDAKILAGGMSMVPAMNLGILRLQTVVSFNHVEGLEYVEDAGDHIRIGCMTRHGRVAADPLVAEHAAVLAQAARRIADVQIRHRGTIGGSVAHADPAADYLPALLVLGASFTLASASGERDVPASEFFVDVMMTALQAGEALVAIDVPKLPAGASSAYVRLARVEGSFAIVNAAAVVANGTATISIGGATATPVVLDPIDVSGGMTDAVAQQLSEAAYAATDDAHGDLSGSADYRRAMARVYAVRAVEAALA